jgi:hypothetical protein
LDPGVSVPHPIFEDRNKAGQWVPGITGNAGGRSKAEGEIRRLARSFAPEAIFTLVRLLRSAKSEKVKHDAANTLLDRGLGKAFQADVPSDDEMDDIKDVSDEALDKLLDS